jgi:integrase
MTAAAAPQPAGSKAANEWAAIAARAPQLADTVTRYLSQAATFLAPNSVDVADLVLRNLACWLLDHSDVRAVAAIGRSHIEDFKVWLTQQPGMRGDGLSQSTQRQRLRMLRVFFERIIEWDWADAPPRNPIIGRDIPPRPDPLPKFLDDRDAARLMAATRAAPDPRDRFVVEVLARTGLRAGELCGLDPDAVALIGDGHWLRVPVGKLRNDRYIPLHPDLVTLFSAWTANNVDHIRHHRCLVADHRGVLDRHIVHRIVRRVARHAGVRVHPH